LPDDGPRRDFVVSADHGNSGDPHSGAGSATSASYKREGTLAPFLQRKSVKAVTKDASAKRGGEKGLAVSRSTRSSRSHR
jgi:hypothetical protein